MAEKSGVIKVFDSLTDTTPTTFADLNVNVYNFWDRGLLGMALAPDFPTDPVVYVLYTYDHELGSTARRRAGDTRRLLRPLPHPAGPDRRRLHGQRRLSRMPAPATCGRRRAGAARGLVPAVPEPLRSATVDFGPDGALYATGGDGASFNYVDWGQDGSPLNPCGDPPGRSAAP